MTDLQERSLVVKVARRITRSIIPADFWPLVDEELSVERADREGMNGHRARDLWTAWQYLAVAVRMGIDRVVSGGREVVIGAGRFTEEWSTDVRLASRALRRRVGTTVTVIVTIALSIGATTSVFSVVDGVLLRPLPYPDAERLVRIWQTRAEWMESSVASQRTLGDRMSINGPIFLDWAQADVGLESMGLYVEASFVLGATDGARVLRGQEANAGLFAALGVEPLLGRWILPSDEVGDSPEVVLLGEAFWTEHFDGSPAAIGATVVLDGRARTIVGVMPDGFGAPTDFGVGEMHPDGSPSLWTPLSDEVKRGDVSGSVLARLAQGVPMSAAAARLASAHAMLRPGHSAWEQGNDVRIESLLDSIVGEVRSTLWFVLAAVGLVLVVAIVNIANVLTASGLTRRRELAVRSALGSGSVRLVRVLLAESALLVGLGGAGGILVAWTSLPLLLRFLPAALPRSEQIGMRPSVLLWGLVVTGLTAILVGVLPAILAARSSPRDAMSASSRSLTVSRSAARLRAGLVIAEVSLAFVLLVGASLLGSSYSRLWGVDRGFVTEGLVGMWIVPDRESHPTREERDRFRAELKAGLESIPGVEASAMNHLPLSGMSSGTSIYLEAESGAPREVSGLIAVGIDGFIDILGVPLVAGRAFQPTDSRDAPPVAIVSESLAQMFGLGSDAVGQRIRTFDDAERSIEVVGVVADVRHEGLSSDFDPKIYQPAAQARRSTNEWVLRIRGDVTSSVRQAREVLAEISPATPVTRVLVLDQSIAESVAIPRFRTLLVGGLATLAGVLALLGVYGVLSFSVAQRTREIGVRVALGALPATVVSDVVREGLRLAATGIALGLLFSWGMAGAVRGFLFEVDPGHLATYIWVVAGLLVASSLAAYLPARRAASVDPVTVLGGD